MINKELIDEYNNSIELLKSKLRQKYEKFVDIGIVIYGTGGGANNFYSLLKEINLDNIVKAICYSDDYQCKYSFNPDLEISSFSCIFQKYPDALYVIASDFVTEILSFVKKNPVIKNRIFKFICV